MQLFVALVVFLQLEVTFFVNRENIDFFFFSFTISLQLDDADADEEESEVDVEEGEDGGVGGHGLPISADDFDVGTADEEIDGGASALPTASSLLFGQTVA